MFFFFKQKTAYEMRISDCSSDVCSSDLPNSVVIRGISPFRPTHPVRAKNDCVRQVSWLPGHCSCPAFPDDIQWHEGPELAGHSCGGSAGSRTRVHFRLPFSSPFGEPVAARLIVPGALIRKPMTTASVAAGEDRKRGE